VIGDSALIALPVMCIDYGWWANGRMTEDQLHQYQELSQKPEVYDLVQKQIEESNKDLRNPPEFTALSSLQGL